MASNKTEEYNQFVSAFNKTKTESNRDEHPSFDQIYLFNRNQLVGKEMKFLKEHTVFCWKCEEVLADIKLMQEIDEEYEAGILTVPIEIPTFNKIRERAYGSPSYNLSNSTFLDKFVKIPEVLSQQIQQILANYDLIPQPITVESKKELKSIKVPCNGEEDEIELYLLEEKNEIEIYTSEKRLIGKSLVIRDTNGEILVKCEFVDDDTTRGMKASSYFSISRVQAEKISLENISSLEVGIE